MSRDLDNSAKEFAVAARAFCAWAEGNPQSADEDFRSVIRLMAQLYASALTLRESGGDESEVKDVSRELLDKVYHHFQSLPFHTYGICFDPLIVPPKGAKVGKLLGDFVEIYDDVKCGLVHYDSGFEEQAIWYWLFQFRHHWGSHLSGALYAMHCYAEGNFLWPHVYLNDAE